MFQMGWVPIELSFGKDKKFFVKIDKKQRFMFMPQVHTCVCDMSSFQDWELPHVSFSYTGLHTVPVIYHPFGVGGIALRMDVTSRH